VIDAPPPATEKRDTIPAPPPWDVAAEFPDDCQITTPDIPPWFDEVAWDDAWPDVPTLVSTGNLTGSAQAH
jgi:hypothetical protein